MAGKNQNPESIVREIRRKTRRKFSIDVIYHTSAENFCPVVNLSVSTSWSVFL